MSIDKYLLVCKEGHPVDPRRILEGTGPSPDLKCWERWDLDGHPFTAHISVRDNELGKKDYMDYHQEAINLWRDWSGKKCDVDSRW